MQNHKRIDALSFIMGGLPYLSYVIFRDLGLDVEIVFFVIIACLSMIGSKGSFNYRLLKIEFLTYFFVVVSVQTIYYSPFHKTFLKGVFVLLSAGLCANYICINFNKRVSSFMKGMIMSIVICEFYIFAFAKYRDLQFEGMRRTLEFFSASQVALASSISIFWGFAKWQTRQKPLYAFVIMLGITSVVVSFSKSGMIAPFISVALYIFLYNQKNRIKAITYMLVFLCIVFLFFGTAFQEIATYIEDENLTQDEFSFNGRLPIWMVAYDYFLQHPWFGNGYYHSQELLEKYTYNNATQAHSLYYQVLMTVGVIGAVSLFATYLRLIIYQRKLLNLFPRNWVLTWFHCMCFYFLIRGVTEGSVAQCASFDSFLFVMILICTIFLFKTTNKHNIKNEISKQISAKPEALQVGFSQDLVGHTRKED